MSIKSGVVKISLLSLLALAGCAADVWEKHASPQYGRDRAEQICHPYSHCTQGVWVANEQALEDPNVAHAMCTEDTLRRENGWSKDTVSLGLEINRCMVAKGYRLVQE